jgi:hypothetical protein
LATFNIKKKSILNACIPLINRQAIESENRTTIGQWSVDRRLKGAIVLPWNRQVLGEWNHLVFFTYEIRNVPFNIQFYISIILLDFP